MNEPITTASDGLELYNHVAESASATVISQYSTSFALACRLLGPRARHHVRNIYALVRVADEVVDGPCVAAGVPGEMTRQILDELEADTLRAVEHGFSVNLVVHAFAATARECGINANLITPFFASMRTDLDVSTHDAASHDDYVYGSAEVVGLMCLQVFTNAGKSHPSPPAPHLVDGARRLGAAFQDVNFLRDLEHDSSDLGRDYLGVDGHTVSRAAVLDRIDGDLSAAAATIPQLPKDCRRAVTAAHDLFAELSARLRASDGGDERVRVPNTVKAALAGRAWLGMPPKEVRS
ncbi:phytoene/squalene synthase family protein [Microbacterium sp. NPDC076911]|uniref:phytoene/squalene synthase family protein n=1 Tax=Microbacterium sp. NPDC076911 TaxID=3154958 RepID=UPI0034189013